MAKNNSLLGDRATGSAGNVTFANWKGIDYLKQKVTHVTNPNTDGQKNQRARMTAMVNAYRTHTALFVLLFREVAIKMSQFNAFVKTNIIDALSIVSVGNVALIPANLKISKGSLGDNGILSVSATEAGSSLTVTFNTTPNESGQSATDKLTLVITDADGANDLKIAIEVAARSAGTYTATGLTSIASGDHINAYFAFTSQDSKKVSDTSYYDVTVGA